MREHHQTIPVAYLTFGPPRRHGIDLSSRVEKWVVSMASRGWAPTFSVAAWFNLLGRWPTRLDSITATSVCFTHLSRSEALILMPGWEKLEMCLLERQYAENNKIPIYTPEDLAELEDSIPEGQAFQRQFLEVKITQKLGHSHAVVLG